jgi:hypothetical protein
MQSLHIAAALIFAHRDHVDRAVQTSFAINDRRRCDSDLWSQLGAAAIIRRRFVRGERRKVPELLPAIGVECIDAIVRRALWPRRAHS